MLGRVNKETVISMPGATGNTPGFVSCLWEFFHGWASNIILRAPIPIPPSRTRNPLSVSLLVSGTNILSRFDFSSSIPKLLISCPLASERVVTTLGHCPVDPCPSRGSPQKEVKVGLGSGRCLPFKSKFFTATHLRCLRSCEEARSSFLSFRSQRI